MRTITKTGILLSILILPVLVFSFLKLFAKNHYDIPVFHATDSVLVNGRYQISAARTFPFFSFINQDNKSFSSTTLKDRIFVVSFLQTTNQDISPVVTTELTRVQEAFADFPEVRIISFSADSSTAAVELLKQYSEAFRVDTSKWTFLHGTKDSIDSLAKHGFLLPVKEDETISPSYLSTLILVDKAGYTRGYYSGADRGEVDRLIREIQVLLHNYDN